MGYFTYLLHYLNLSEKLTLWKVGRVQSEERSIPSIDFSLSALDEAFRKHAKTPFDNDTERFQKEKGKCH